MTCPRPHKTWIKAHQAIILPILFLLCILCLTACSTTRPVVQTMPELHTFVTDTRSDHIIWRDRYHLVEARNDTIYIHDSIFVLVATDSVRTITTQDSIPYPVEVIVTKEVQMHPAWHRFLVWFFVCTIALLIIRIAYAIYFRR